jgi:DNA end-binding protein Ku
MAARAIASGTISFGLVSVPVKLYTATRSKSVSFNLLHEKDRSRLRQQYVCGACGEVVERSAMVKGYEYAKDQYVLFTDEELRALEQQTDQSIEIEAFVPIQTVDPIYFDKAYLLGPDKGGAKAYRLLGQAMAKAGRGAVAKFSTRGKQELVVLRCVEDGLVMHTLHYADEVSSMAEIDRGESVALKEGELDLAVQLIGQLASPALRVERYSDEYRTKLLEAIDRKVAGQDVALSPARPAKAQIIDLMEALKASLAARAPSVAPEARKPAQAKAKAAAPARKAAGRGK